jgi:threonine synthase
MEGEKKQMRITCNNCGELYPADETPYVCPSCGGIFDIDGLFPYNPENKGKDLPGIWRFRQSFPLSLNDDPVSLGEGNTPLIWAEVASRKVGFKCEYQNPTGSFKDRGSSVLTTWLKSRRVGEAIEDSSGNAGSSFAAYAARSGIKAKIFVPDSASAPKQKQIKAYGATIVTISGSRSDVTEAVHKEANQGIPYASHACLPFNLPGYATVAYEIYEQLGDFPGTVIVPAGQGGLLLGIARGFQSLGNAYSKNNSPKLIGVQAKVCSPLLEMFMHFGKEQEFNSEVHTLAEGVKVCFPVRGKQVVETVKASNGMIFGTEEDEILPGRYALSRLGFYVEPTSAIVWSALIHLMNELKDPIIVILTGSGLKSG